MKIKMKTGILGVKENGRIVAKDSDSKPFDLEEERAKELIEKGFAIEVIEEQKDVENQEDIDQENDNLDDLSKTELVKIAKELGVKSYGKRDEILERIKTKLSEEEVDDEKPNLGTAEIE